MSCGGSRSSVRASSIVSARPSALVEPRATVAGLAWPRHRAGAPCRPGLLRRPRRSPSPPPRPPRRRAMRSARPRGRALAGRRRVPGQRRARPVVAAPRVAEADDEQAARHPRRLPVSGSGSHKRTPARRSRGRLHRQPGLARQQLTGVLLGHAHALDHRLERIAVEVLEIPSLKRNRGNRSGHTGTIPAAASIESNRLSRRRHASKQRAHLPRRRPAADERAQGRRPGEGANRCAAGLHPARPSRPGPNRVPAAHCRLRSGRATCLWW